MIETYEHRVGVHCESGSLRNLLNFSGLDVSEAMIFGIGSGPTFYYLFFAQGPSTFPLIGIRNQPAGIYGNVSQRCGIDISYQQYPSTDEAMREANILLDIGRPVTIAVDMYYMKYLPIFLRVHTPFHCIILFGRDKGNGAENGSYSVSDPYSAPVGVLDIETLRAAWNPNASLSKDNWMAYVKRVPRSINWERAAIEAMKDHCKKMVLPPVVNRAFWFVGIQGMRTFAKAMRGWGKKYKGVILREGILFNAVGFEDQGTGGGAFRIMYGAFLQEVSEMLHSNELNELAERMAAHGQSWRKFSRKIVEVGKKVPKKEEEYPDWYAKNATTLHQGLNDAADLFLEKAAFEEQFFKDLLKAVNRL